MDDNYRFLIGKLDHFIRKYYKNRIIKGVLYSIALGALFYLLVSLLEFIGHFDILTRTLLFYSFLGGISIILGRFIAIPVFQLFRIGKIISHEQAALIIGKHFPDVKDKLLNTLQLRRIDEPASRELIRASIDQKIRQLTPVPFHAAINIRENRKYVKYALLPIAVIVFLLIASPNIIKEPTRRIVKHNVAFERELPFTVWIENTQLRALKNEDFLLTIGVSGEEIPEAMYLDMDGQSLKLGRERNNRFSYLFRNVQRNIAFYIVADRFRSDLNEIVVVPVPLIGRFEIAIDNPGYTGKKDEVIENAGDIIIPEGARISWTFYTSDTDSLWFSMNGERTLLRESGDDRFVHDQSCFKSAYYSVKTINRYVTDPDSLFYTVTVIPDLYPTILVDEFSDSLFGNRRYFRGNIKDDYGFERLTFVYHKKTKGSQQEQPSDSIQNLSVNSRQLQQTFYHSFDAATLSLSPGDEIGYYFEVWDNDAVNGSKSTRTPRMTFRVPSLDEIEQQAEAASETIKNEMEMMLQDLKGIQKEMEDLHKNLIEKKELNWQEQQRMEQLLQRQQSLQDKLEDMKLENIEKSLKEQQYKEVDQDILDKQKELERLFDEILTDDIKKLYEELQKMMDEMDKEKINEMLEKMKWANEDLEEQLDRSLELFKRLEFEKKLTETIDKIDKLAQDQEKLAEETEKAKEEPKESLLDEQKEIGEDFKKIREELDELEEMNQKLEDPNKLDNTDEQEEGIEEDMENSKNELEQNKRSKASKSQQNAAQKMKNLSENLSDMLNGMQSEQLGEDIGKLREILENLIQVSFDQENLMTDLKVTGRNDPNYNTIVQLQKKVKDDLLMIEDSLFALSKRQVTIKPLVQREINEIDDKLARTLEELANKNISSAMSSQQFVMTSVNNLALLLAEALENMQNQMSQMSNSSGGGSSCPNPGSGAPSSISTMKQLQEQLNKQLEKLKNGMEPQGKGQGKQGQQMTSWSEQLARMAAQQEAIRNQLQQYMEDLKEQGISDDGSMGKMIQDMEQTETEIVNKMITDQTLMRQQDIMTRLLESEKAERMRELEEQRESKEVKNQKISNPEEFFKYKGIKDNQTEILRSIPPSLKPFYKRKVNEYLFNFED